MELTTFINYKNKAIGKFTNEINHGRYTVVDEQLVYETELKVGFDIYTKEKEEPFRVVIEK